MLSRVADNLYWMGRYLERAEHMSRLLATHVDLALELSAAQVDALLGPLLEARGHRPPATGPLSVDGLVFDAARQDSVAHGISAARNNARQLRDHIPAELWEHLNALYLLIATPELSRTWKSQPEDVFRLLFRSFRLHHGSIDVAMERSEGWHFMRLGRYLEQGSNLVGMFAAHSRVTASRAQAACDPQHDLRWLVLLRAAQAVEPYRRFHSATLKPEAILRFLLFEAKLPQSLHFALQRIVEDTAAIAELSARPWGNPSLRAAETLRLVLTEIDGAALGELDLSALMTKLQTALEAVHRRTYAAYLDYPVTAMLAGSTPPPAA